MMKIEIEKDFPQYFKPAYPEEFELLECEEGEEENHTPPYLLSRSARLRKNLL